MKRAVLLSVSALVVAACNDSTMEPNSPTTAITPSQAQFSIATTTNAGAEANLTGDLRLLYNVVIPNLSNETAAEQLKVQILALSAALDAGDKAAAAQAIQAADNISAPGIGSVSVVGRIDRVLALYAKSLQ
jgi:hypothetical protein